MENETRKSLGTFRGCGDGNPTASCEHYDPSAGECLLLRERRMDEFWEKGRCLPFGMLYRSVSDCLSRLKRTYRYLPIDEAEDVDFGRLAARLRKQGLRREFNLTGWRKYVNKAVRREITWILAGRGLIPRRTECGTCRHLTLSRPRVCLKTGESRKKSQTICDSYAWHSHMFVSADPEALVVPGNLPVAGRRRGAGGDGTETPATLLEDKEEGKRIFLMRDALARRAEAAEAGSVRKKRYERQYEVFSNLLSLFSQGVPRKRVCTVLEEKTGIRVRTIRRDLEEIRLFLKNNHEDGVFS